MTSLPSTPKDFLGHTIRVGYTIIYPINPGRELKMRKGTVERIINLGSEDAPRFILKVRTEGVSKLVTVRHLDRVVIVVD